MADQRPERKVLEDVLIPLLMVNRRPPIEDAPVKMKILGSWPTGTATETRGDQGPQLLLNPLMPFI